MKYTDCVRALILVAGLVLISPWSALAQPQPQQPPPPHIWGAASNGLCVGVSVRPGEWSTNKNDYYCDIGVKDVSTNRLYIWRPSREERYEIELQGPDGQRIRQRKPLFLSWNSWLAREPLSEDGGGLDWFFLRDAFDVRTNGLHTLIVSARVNAFTNFSAGRYEMRRKPVYFLLPPVTNTFNVLPLGPGKRS